MFLLINGPDALVIRLRDFNIIGVPANDGSGEIEIEVSSANELMRIANVLDMLGYE